MSQHKPCPNGGEARELPTQLAKMPKKQKVGPVTHTPLAIPTAKMPRKSSAPLQTEPRRR